MLKEIEEKIANAAIKSIHKTSEGIYENNCVKEEQEVERRGKVRTKQQKSDSCWIEKIVWLTKGGGNMCGFHSFVEILLMSRSVGVAFGGMLWG